MTELHRPSASVSSVLSLTVAVFINAFLLGTGHAQLSGYYPVGADALSLNNADFTMLIDTANGLLRRSPLPIGASASWRNDRTGSNGTIRVTRTFHRADMLCHTLVYQTIPAATPPANRTVLNWCKTGDGAWKILS